MTPLQPDAWREWFSKQLALTRRATPEGGLYVGLRLDGRVRASGMGAPPWERFVAELAPVEGATCSDDGACALASALNQPAMPRTIVRHHQTTDEQLLLCHHR